MGNEIAVIGYLNSTYSLKKLNIIREVLLENGFDYNFIDPYTNEIYNIEEKCIFNLSSGNNIQPYLFALKDKLKIFDEETVNIANIKTITAKFLEDNKFPMPKTRCYACDCYNDVQYDFDFPMIIKDSKGLGQKDTFVVNTYNDLRDIATTKFSSGSFIAQTYIKEQKGVDYRIYVVFDGKEYQVVGAIKRINMNNMDMKENIKQEGSAEEYTPTEEEIKLVKEVAEKAKLKFGAVDIIHDDGKPLVLELTLNIGCTDPLTEKYIRQMTTIMVPYLKEQIKIAETRKV